MLVNIISVVMTTKQMSHYNITKYDLLQVCYAYTYGHCVRNSRNYCSIVSCTLGGDTLLSTFSQLPDLSPNLSQYNILHTTINRVNVETLKMQNLKWFLMTWELQFYYSNCINNCSVDPICSTSYAHTYVQASQDCRVCGVIYVDTQTCTTKWAIALVWRTDQQIA